MKLSFNAKKQRGVALITALLMTIVFLVLIGGLMAQMITELQDVGAHSNSAKALNAAYSGVENMVLQIEENASGAGKVAPAPISYSYPAPSTVKYDVSVTTTWNSSNGLIYYQISSTGTETKSGQTRSVQALVRSFPFSYFEQFTASNSGSVYYVTGEKFDGPVYNGGTMNVWYQDPAAAIFNNTVTTVQSPNWYEGAGFNPVTYANVKWGDVMSMGQNGFKIGTNPMQLPTFINNLTVSSESFYGDSTHTSQLPTPGHNGLFVNGHDATAGPAAALTTGLYLQGDVKIHPCSGSCGSYSGNNEVWTLNPWTSGSSTPLDHDYTVAINFTAKTTTITQTSGCSGTCPSVTYTGTLSGQPAAGVVAGNGAIFVNGDARLYNGTVHGDYTISVPDYSTDNSHTITMRGSAPGIVYLDQSATSTDELGVWANDIYIDSSTTTGYEFDGDILTGYYGECPPCTDGNFSNPNYNSPPPQGNFTLFGGLVQDTSGTLGIQSGGTLVSGFRRVYKYDPRMASNPPPFFPITNKYDIIAWLDEGH